MTDDSQEKSHFTKADRKLLRSIGANLHRIIQDQIIGSDDVDRRDELGILANMVNRVGKELWNSRRRDEEQRKEREARLEELRESHDTQERLMATIRELSTPILSIYKSIVLLPIVGGIDSLRSQQMTSVLLERIRAERARVVILDITAVPVIDTQVANALLQSSQAAGLLGARVILCGMTPDVAQVVVSLGIDLNALTPVSDLQAALTLALHLTGCRITNRPS